MDILGNIYGIINSSGSYIVKYEYNAYGEVTKNIIATSGDDLIVANHNPYMYKGYYYDDALQCYYLKSRFYMPSICRFISPDDHSYLDYEDLRGINLYCYCYDNPVMYEDGEGRFPITTLIIATLIGAAIGTVIEVGKQIYDGGKWNWDLSTWNYWEIGKGTLIGAASGLAYGLGGIAGGIVRGSVKVLKIAGKVFTISRSVGLLLGVAASTSFIAGFGGYALHTAGTQEDDFNFIKGFSEGIGQSVKGILSFGTGGMFGASGVWKFGQNIPIRKHIINAMYRGAARLAANIIPNYVIDAIFKGASL